MFDREFVIQFFRGIMEKVKREQIFDRELKVDFLKNKAVVIMGPRRSGKTYFLLNMLKKSENAVYVDFEHSAFKDITHKELFEIISIFEEYFGVKVERVLLDELQRVKDWESLVRSMLDSGYYLIISGSSSRLSGREIAAQLRGRCISYLFLPFSFREYLKFHGVEVKKLVSISEKEKILRLLEEYMEWGGYPEVSMFREMREKILRDYYDAIFYRDFVGSFERVNTNAARLVFEFALQNFSCEMSFNKMANYVSSRMKRDVKNIVYEYAERLPEGMNVFFVDKYSESVYERKSLMKKVYISDLGLASVLGIGRDIGMRMENAVFLDLLRRTNVPSMYEIFYWKDYQQREVDFVIKHGIKVEQLIQVTYAKTTEDVKEREVESLLRASEALSCEDLMVITWDYENDINVKNKVIRFIPLWKWLLEEIPFSDPNTAL